MLSLYQTLFYDHDIRFVLLAIAVCVLGSATGVAIAQHGLKPQTLSSRRNWLLLAGLVTGLAVWTTHFTAMLGYRNDLDIRFDLFAAFLSIILSVPLAMAGWVFGFIRHQRGLTAGVIIGLSIAVAHFIDMHAMQVAGTIHHSHMASLVAVVCGASLGALAGHLFGRFRHLIFAWPAAMALFAAIVSLHFVAMAGVSIMPDGTTMETSGLTASSNHLATIVVAAFLVLLAAAITFTWHSESLARATAEEHGRLVEALADLRKTQDHHRSYVELSPQIAWVSDPQGRVTEIAPRWEELVGISREEGLGKGWARPVHPDDLPAVFETWQGAIEAGDADLADVRYRVLLVDGSYRWFRARARPRCDVDGNIIAWYGSLEDVHDQVLAENALRKSEERYREASSATNDVIWEWCFEKQRATWAGAHLKVLGYPELLGETAVNWWLDRIHPEDRDKVLASQATALANGEDHWNEEYRFLPACGDWIDVKSRSVIVRDENGQPIRLVGSMLDITQQKKAEAELHWAAYHDPLTELPNRSLYRKRIETALDEARVNDRCVGLVSLDLNRFKTLNDTLGHAAGDTILQDTARRLISSAPQDATVARLGGDEFAIILPNLDMAEATVETVAGLLACLEEPVSIGDMRIEVSYCAGVAIWPRDADIAGDLLIAADLALYAAKEEMPGTVKIFDPSLRHAAERRTRMLDTARKALNEDRIIPYYQPKIDFQTGQIMGWEALLRVRSEGGGIMSPAEIEAAFADVDLTVKLTDRMLARVFADMAVWQSKGIDPGRVAVNVAAGDFRLNDLANRLKSHAAIHGQSLAELDIEVTEGVLIGQLGPEVSRMLEELRAVGVMVALDDFGTGYASLTHLQQFAVDVIKIDKSFVDRIDENDPKGTAVVDAVLQMAKRLGMQTVAEGVETKEQARYLRARGCTIGQGYLFSRPVPASNVPTIVAKQPFAGWEFETDAKDGKSTESRHPRHRHGALC